MTNLPPLYVEIKADIDQLKTGLAQAQTAINNFGGTISKNTNVMSNFRATAAGMFAANIITMATTTIVGGIRSVIAETKQYEQLLAKTNAVITSTGNVAGLSVQGLKDQAAALEQVSGVDELLILNGENVLATFTNIRNVAGAGNDIFNQTTQAALDLSVAMGTDMQSAVVQLGKALSNPLVGMSALQRVGVTFNAQQKKQIETMLKANDALGAQKLILQEVQKEFGGAAAAAGDTLAGDMERLKDKVTDFIRDGLLRLENPMRTVVGWFGSLADAAINAAGWLAYHPEIYTAIAAAITAYTLVALANLTVSIWRSVAAWMAETAAIGLANSTIMLTVAAVALLAGWFIYTWNQSDALFKLFQLGGKVMVTVIEWIGRGLVALGQIMYDRLIWPFREFLKLVALIPGPFQAAANTAVGFLDGIDTKLNNSSTAIANWATDTRKAIDKWKYSPISLDLKLPELKVPEIKTPKVKTPLLDTPKITAGTLDVKYIPGTRAWFRHEAGATTYTYNISTTANSNASPKLIADSTIRAIKYGTPINVGTRPKLKSGGTTATSAWAAGQVS